MSIHPNQEVVSSNHFFICNIKIKLILLVFVFIFSGLLKAQSLSKKTNIVLIMTDDQGYGDFGFTGNPYVKTPNIDKLAGKSVRLTNYHHSPVCAPTRASLLTGRYHERTGVHDTWNNGAIMAAEETTLAEILAQNGYATGISGKWHLGDNFPFRPSEQGFQYSFIHGGGGIGQPGDLPENYVRKDSSYFNTTFLENNKKVKSSGYCSDAITDAGIKFLKDQKTKPFFLYVSFNAPHDPLQVPKKYEDLYKDLKFDSSFDLEPGKPWAVMSEQDKVNARKIYGMVSNIDDNIGRLLSAIQEMDLESNTIVIFTTDNGNQQLRYNTGFRGLKGTVYEGGTRVPQLIYGKGFIPGNKEVHALLAHIDMLPTILDALNIPLPQNIQPDGKSFFPLLKGGVNNIAERNFYNSWNRGWPEPYRNAAYYQGDYKLVAINAESTDLPSFGLYNLRKDPFELTNLVNTNQTMVAKLKLGMDSIYESISASPHLSPSKISVGTKAENPVLLTRQDWNGIALRNWNAESSLGYWTITIQEEGDYELKLINFIPLKSGTRALIRLGKLQRSKIFRSEVTTVTMDPVHLLKGDYILESWYELDGNVTAPYYLEILKKN